MSTTTVGLKLQLVGNAKQQLQGLYSDTVRNQRLVTDELKRTTSQLHDANNLRKLNLRTERDIRTEIKRTQQAYEAIRRSGTASANEIKRAYAAMRHEVKGLNNELRTSPSLTSRIGVAINKGTAIAGGLAAGGYVVKRQLDKAYTYEERVAGITGTLTDKSMTLDARKKMANDVNNSIVGAVRTGGGTRDAAAEAMGELVASGQFAGTDLDKALVVAVKAAVGSQGSAVDTANMIKAFKQFGITDYALASDIAVAGGKAGSFELKDQARYLPSQIALAKPLGYSGLEGLSKLTALNQVAMTTAGSADEAGNNVVNLLQKLSNADFARTAKKQTGVNWGEYQLTQAQQGLGGVEAFGKLLEQQLAKNATYQQLKSQAGNAKGDDKLEILNRMANIAETSELGKLIADRQALLAALAVQANPELMQQVQAKTTADAARGSTDAEAEFINSFGFAKARQTEQELLFANNNLYQQVNEKLGSFLDNLNQAMSGNEELTTAAYGAGTALTALAGMIGVGGLLSGGGLFGGMGKGAGGLFGGMSTLTKTVAGRAGLLGAVGVASWEAGSYINDKYVAPNADLSDKIGGTIHTILANLGVESSQQALDDHFNNMINLNQQSNTKYDQMIAEQRQTIAVQSQMLTTLQSINNKPAPTITVGNQLLATSMLEEVSNLDKRGKFSLYR